MKHIYYCRPCDEVWDDDELHILYGEHDLTSYPCPNKCGWPAFLFLDYDIVLDNPKIVKTFAISNITDSDEK